MVVFLLQMSEADQARVRLISAQVQARNTERQRLRVQLDTAVQAEQLPREQFPRIGSSKSGRGNRGH
jgi:hypothetical protein